MLFSSIEFLYYFLPAVLIVYFVVPRKAKNAVLLAASLLFYFYGEQVYTLLMLGLAFSAYVHGLLIDKFRGKTLSKVFLVSSVTVSLLLLGLFKYADFFITNCNMLLGTQLSLLKLLLPIGISFYTFQTLSYTVDVYRGQAAVQKNFLHLALYVTLFPQLIAGPIVRYTTVEQELSHRTHSFADFSYGAARFVLGLSKKVLLANLLGQFCQIFRSSTEKSVLFYWAYAVAYTLHIYFDFSGYSDMAIGLGRIFGFHFLENFNYPYMAKTISEFWRRWHISLGSWFRDYVYIPMGGNRVPFARWLLNIAAVWFLTGFWHGADWTFIVWGLLYAVFLVLEKLFLAKALQKLPEFISHCYVLLVVMLGFVIFNANGMPQALGDLASLFGLGNLPLYSAETFYYLGSYAVVLALAIIGCTPLCKNLLARLTRGFDDACTACKVYNILQPAVLAVLLVVCTAYLVDGSFNPFLYFRF